MDLNIVRSVVTLVSLLVFLGIVVWAYSGRNKKHFDDMAALPLDDTGEASGRAQ
jgi:cytochrome c oxidase cbb3-type subunit 4